MSAIARYVPPRPNLGPEPWPAAGASPWGWIAGASGLAFLALALALWTRRRPRRPAVATRPDVEDEARPRMVAQAEAVRNALIARFGPAWASRTTEEIAADPTLVDAVGVEWVGPLLALLRAADVAKFAAIPTAPDQGDDWDGWVVAFLAALPGAPPANSSQARARVAARA